MGLMKASSAARFLFINLGRNASALSGGSRAGQWMLLKQAMNEADKPPTVNETALLTRAGRSALSSYTSVGKVIFNVDRASDILETTPIRKNLRPRRRGSQVAGKRGWSRPNSPLPR